tara:strand:+ start:87 stop:488 length:402 start_codon:yes stop_codon:yes gene_type:complete
MVVSNLTFGEMQDFINDRQAMFKESKKNMKILRSSIRNRDSEEGLATITFHLDWSQRLAYLFPIGSEASITNESDASDAIWSDFEGFKSLSDDYFKKSLSLKTALETENFVSAKDSFLLMTRTCKTCHEKFRN